MILWIVLLLPTKSTKVHERMRAYIVELVIWNHHRSRGINGFTRIGTDYLKWVVGVTFKVAKSTKGFDR